MLVFFEANGSAFTVEPRGGVPLSAEVATGEDEAARAFSARLRQALGEESAKAFADRTGIPYGGFRKYFQGTMPPIDTAARIARGANVMLAWLATGDGPMRLSGDVPVVQAPEDGDLVSVPFFQASASAGPGLVPIENSAELAYRFDAGFLRQYGLFPSTTAALRIEGDSMLRPDGSGIPPGALALINTAIGADDVITGCVYVLTLNGELKVKRIERRADRTITLHSDNPRYKPEHIKRDVMPSLHIAGRLKLVVLEY